MSMYTPFILLFALAAVYGIPFPDDDPTPVVMDKGGYKMEPECAKTGGMCMLAEDCPKGQLSATLGLCPKQQEQGVECCHGLSIRERRCGARGGICRNKCGRQLLLDADDCPAGFSCCVLV